MLKKWLFLFSLGSAALQAGSVSCVANDCCYPYAVTPPLTSGGCGLEFGLSLLYLKPDALNSNWAEAVSTENDFYTYQGYRVPYGWDYGFSVDLGYKLPCDFWSVKAAWMHFEEQNNESLYGFVTADEVGEWVYPANFFFFGGSGNNVQTALEGDFTLQVNRLDLVLSRESLLGPHLTFSPFFGLRAVFLRNKENWSYAVDASGTGTIPSIDSFTAESRFSSNMRSLGVVGGMHASYEWMCGLEFVGDFAASLLYGHQKISSRIDISGNTNLNGFDITGSHWGLVPETDLFLGMAWRGDNLLSSCGSFRVSAGWENQLYLRGYNRPTFGFGGESGGNPTNFSSPFLSLTGIRLAIDAEF